MVERVSCNPAQANNGVPRLRCHRRLKEQQGQTLRNATAQRAVCSCCPKATAQPLDSAKPLRSPVKMWISAAVDDSEARTFSSQKCFKGHHVSLFALTTHCTGGEVTQARS